MLAHESFQIVEGRKVPEIRNHIIEKRRIERVESKREITARMGTDHFSALLFSPYDNLRKDYAMPKGYTVKVLVLMAGIVCRQPLKRRIALLVKYGITGRNSGQPNGEWHLGPMSSPELGRSRVCGPP